jgi:SsrA-binding protein
VYNIKERGIFVENTKTITTNKKAFHEYFVVESFECGIALSGTEIKSIRAGGVNLKDAWCNIENGEMIIKQMHISPYEHGNRFNKPPARDRKLLMHKREIMRLFGTVKQEGLALVPLSLYFKGSLVKVQLGLCKGKKLHDKRQVAAQRDANRAIDRAIKEQNR